MSSYQRIYEVVRRVPRGRVITYGRVAILAGLPGQARQVGYAMAAVAEESNVPWHRVVNARGEISRRSDGAASERIQRALLEGEGVRFGPSGRIDLERFAAPLPRATGGKRSGPAPSRRAPEDD